MSILKSICIAFSIYSKIPMPQFEWKEEDMKFNLIFFPWIGAVIGFVLFGWMKLCVHFKLSAVCMYMIGTAIPIIISGGFHVDGYMDTMDAFHSYQPRERKLEILKDSHIGAFAVIMLVLYYLIYVGAFAQITSTSAFGVFCMGFFVTRCLSGIGVVSFKSAKSDGMLQTFASTADEKIVKICLYIQLIACFAAMLYVDLIAGGLVIAVSLLCFLYYWWKSKKELGGITGDTAGYFVTVCEGAIVIAAAIGSLI